MDDNRGLRPAGSLRLCASLYGVGDMTDEAKARLDVALWMLFLWLRSYDLNSSSPYGLVRRRAMYARAAGLLDHDRILTGRVPL